MKTSNDFGARILGDIGGTNARFAWQAGPGAPLQHGLILSCADHPTLAAAIDEYLRRIGAPRPAAASIAIANPIQGDHVQMTNHSWSFSIREMQRSFKLKQFVVLNDFKAIALALPALPVEDLRQVGGGQSCNDGPRAVIGPGTGLGVAGLVGDDRGGWVAIDGEGGHATLAATNEREWRVIEWLDRRYGHASAERAVSGPGLADLYTALREIDGDGSRDGGRDGSRDGGRDGSHDGGRDGNGHRDGVRAGDEPIAIDAATITGLALEGQDRRAIEALDLFCAFLGIVAGNLALTLGATGGVYIGGGIVPRLGGFFDRSSFRSRFEAKGRFASYVASIPTFVIVRETSPALIGAERALDAAIATEDAARAAVSRRS